MSGRVALVNSQRGTNMEDLAIAETPWGDNAVADHEIVAALLVCDEGKIRDNSVFCVGVSDPRVETVSAAEKVQVAYAAKPALEEFFGEFGQGVIGVFFHPDHESPAIVAREMKLTADSADVRLLDHLVCMLFFDADTQPPTDKQKEFGKACAKVAKRIREDDAWLGKYYLHSIDKDSGFSAKVVACYDLSDEADNAAIADLASSVHFDNSRTDSTVTLVADENENVYWMAQGVPPREADEDVAKQALEVRSRFGCSQVVCIVANYVADDLIVVEMTREDKGLTTPEMASLHGRAVARQDNDSTVTKQKLAVQARWLVEKQQS